MGILLISKFVSNDFYAYNFKYSMQKSRLIIFITLLVVAVVGLWYTFFRTPQITGLEVALKISTFLDKTLQPDGGMVAGFECDSTTHECSPIAVKNDKSNLTLDQTIYGYYVLAKISGDDTYQTNADRALDLVLDKCQKTVQVCAWNFLPLARYYFGTKEDRYLQGMLRPAEEFLVMSNAEIIKQKVGHKLSSLYQATGEERYKKRLLEIADDELLSWPRGQEGVMATYSIQVIWSIFLPAYDITHDQKYLSASEQFFDSFNLIKYFERGGHIEAVMKGADALLSLSKASSHGAIYRTQAHAVLQEILNKSWDSPQNPQINGDYGFLSTASTDKNTKTKMTINSGWLMRLFGTMADEKFNLPSK